MRKRFGLAVAFLAISLPLAAQDWSFGVATGPFVFGDFVKRTMRLTNDQGPGEAITMVLSAAVRPGIAVDIERSLGERWAIRLEGTFTRAPLEAKQEGTDGVSLEAADMNAATFMLPVIFRINPRGTFRFHLLAGPALAIYDAEPRNGAPATLPVFAESQQEWGYAFGGGVGWWLSDRFAIEGNITDTITSSPFEGVYPDVPGIEVPKPHNVHTTVGARWRF